MEFGAHKNPGKLPMSPILSAAGRHDALDTEVEHAGALADQLAHGGEDQRRGDADRGGPETGRDENIKDVHQPRLTLNLVSMIASTIKSSATASMMSAR